MNVTVVCYKKYWLRNKIIIISKHPMKQSFNSKMLTSDCPGTRYIIYVKSEVLRYISITY